MKFTLTFDGELRSNGTRDQKWAIRQALSPQMEELWRIDPVLHHVEKRRIMPTGGFWVMDAHHSTDGKRPPPPPIHGETLDLLAPISRNGWNFIPLIRDSLALRCGLKITFLRKEEPGRVYQGGDLDNRLKTLFDALSVPNTDQVTGGKPASEPVYCLLEDDSLIAGLAVETGRLLSRPNSSTHEVRLVIEVDVRVAQARVYNQLFLGD